MASERKPDSVCGMIILFLVLLNVIFIKASYTNDENWYWFLIITIPLLLLVIVNRAQRKHAVLRNFLIIGYVSYFLESIRPELSNISLNLTWMEDPSTSASAQLYIKGQKMENKRLLLVCRQIQTHQALNGWHILYIR